MRLHGSMEAKVVFVARTTSPDLFLPVEIRKNRPVEPERKIYGYYLRYRQNGRRKVEPVAKDSTTAYAAYRNCKLNHKRVRMGLEPIHGPAALVRDFDRIPMAESGLQTLLRSTSTISRITSRPVIGRAPCFKPTRSP